MIASISWPQSALNFFLNRIWFVKVVPKYLNSSTLSKVLLSIWRYALMWLIKSLHEVAEDALTATRDLFVCVQCMNYVTADRMITIWIIIGNKILWLTEQTFWASNKRTNRSTPYAAKGLVNAKNHKEPTKLSCFQESGVLYFQTGGK